MIQGISSSYSVIRFTLAACNNQVVASALTARVLRLVAGRLAPGLAGDVLVLREAGLELRWSFARGKKVLAPGWVKKGMFEK